MYSLFILVPFLIVLVLNLPFKALMKKNAFWAAMLFTTLQVTAALALQGVAVGDHSETFAGFLRLNFWVDNLTNVMLLCGGLVGLVVVLVERYLSRDEEQSFRFLNVLFLVLAGMNGTVLVRDIFSLYVFLEIAAVSSFILIGINKEKDACEAAFKYIIMSVVATVLMLSSIAIFLMIAGDTSFVAVHQALSTSPDRLLIVVAVAIFLCAAFIKSGVMPFHGWLPDAYSAAPAPVSVLLAGIVTKTVGVYLLIRVVHTVVGLNAGVSQILLWAGTVSVILAALAALGQKDIKRMLAYSSISQIGYIVLGLGAGNALGLAGALFHIFNHTVFKSLLFVNAAAVESATGTRKMDELSGLAQKMPLTGTTSVLASLSCAGIPPLSGFWSKLFIIMALWKANLYGIAIVAALASVLTLAYFLMMQRMAFFGKLREELSHVKEVGFGLALPMIILAFITVVAGLGFAFIMPWFTLPMGMIAGG
jgi:proton-translocating NADH-quinone oxidoreductase chain N